MKALISSVSRFTSPTGICRYAASLAKCLQGSAEIDKVTLAVGAWQIEYFRSCFGMDSTEIEIRAVDIRNSSVSRNAWSMYQCPTLAEATEADIVHLAYPVPIDRARFHVPVVATVHDLYPYDFPQNFGFPRYYLNRWFLKKCVKESDSICCVSRNTRERLQHHMGRLLGRKSVEVVYNYVDYSDVVPHRPAQVRDMSSDYVLAVAQHRKNKSLHLLIQAFAELRGNGVLPSVAKLIIVGGIGPETSSLVNLVEGLGLSRNVEFLYSIEQSELAWLYQHTKAFVAASDAEGFCIPLVEAMYYSAPVVCSDITIFREIAPADATLFSLKGNVVTNLTHAIACALQKETVQSTFPARFGISEATAKYENVYRSLQPMCIAQAAKATI